MAPAAFLVAAALEPALALEPLALAMAPALAGALAAPLLRGPQMVSNMAQ